MRAAKEKRDAWQEVGVFVKRGRALRAMRSVLARAACLCDAQASGLPAPVHSRERSLQVKRVRQNTKQNMVLLTSEVEQHESMIGGHSHKVVWLDSPRQRFYIEDEPSMVWYDLSGRAYDAQAQLDQETCFQAESGCWAQNQGTPSSQLATPQSILRKRRCPQSSPLYSATHDLLPHANVNSDSDSAHGPSRDLGEEPSSLPSTALEERAPESEHAHEKFQNVRGIQSPRCAVAQAYILPVELMPKVPQRRLQRQLTPGHGQLARVAALVEDGQPAITDKA